MGAYVQLLLAVLCEDWLPSVVAYMFRIQWQICYLHTSYIGFGAPQGAECAVHAARIFLDNLSQHEALLKVDFRNAFNSIRRDKMMLAAELFVPSLLPFIRSAYSHSSKIFWHDAKLTSAEDVQQGDPIGPLLFCLTIHGLVSQLQTAFNVWYLDDGTLGGDGTELVGALRTIKHEGEKLGLHLNLHKCELICQNPSAMQSLVDSFPSLKVVKPSDATLLGSPLTKNCRVFMP